MVGKSDFKENPKSDLDLDVILSAVEEEQQATRTMSPTPGILYGSTRVHQTPLASKVQKGGVIFM